MARVLVVGGAGYVGGWLVDRAVEAGHEVLVYDLLLYEDRFLKDVPFVSGDVLDRERLRPHLEWADAVVWLAALVGDPACALDPAADAQDQPRDASTGSPRSSTAGSCSRRRARSTARRTRSSTRPARRRRSRSTPRRSSRPSSVLLERAARQPRAAARDAGRHRRHVLAHPPRPRRQPADRAGQDDRPAAGLRRHASTGRCCTSATSPRRSCRTSSPRPGGVYNLGTENMTIAGARRARRRARRRRRDRVGRHAVPGHAQLPHVVREGASRSSASRRASRSTTRSTRSRR